MNGEKDMEKDEIFEKENSLSSSAGGNENEKVEVQSTETSNVSTTTSENKTSQDTYQSGSYQTTKMSDTASLSGRNQNSQSTGSYQYYGNAQGYHNTGYSQSAANTSNTGVFQNSVNTGNSQNIGNTSNTRYSQNTVNTSNKGYSQNTANTGNYSNYAAGGSQQRYGNYQYNANGAYGANIANSNGAQPQKPKKGVFKRLLAFVLVCAVLCGLAAGGYYAVRHTDFFVKDKKDTRKVATTESSIAADSNSSKKSENGDKTVVTDVTQVVKQNMPAIVAIDNNFTQSVNSYWGKIGEQEVTANGSGIIIGKNDTELLVVTNNHVVEGADELKVQFIDGSKAGANIKGTNADMDLAVIAVKLQSLSDDTMSQIAIATLGNSDNLQLGEPAIAIGNALGYGQSVTVGVISALNRAVANGKGSEGTFLQTDAAINPGNSGGALLNSKGELIGINSAKYAAQDVEGMGFAIPISIAKPIIDELMNEETKYKVDKDKKGYLGVTVYTPTGVDGAYVASVAKNSAAEKAGIKAGDIITKLNDTEINSRDDLINNLSFFGAGEKVKVKVLRKGASGYEEHELEVTLQKK